MKRVERYSIRRFMNKFTSFTLVRVSNISTRITLRVSNIFTSFTLRVSNIFPYINQRLILTYLCLGYAAGSFKPRTLDGVLHGGEKGISRHSFCKMNILCTSFAIHLFLRIHFWLRVNDRTFDQFT
jgi:hypothetical protein